jgi:hypothetical protein
VSHVAALTFDADRHVYAFGGRAVPSVTRILRIANLRFDESGAVMRDGFDFVDPDLLKRARIFGSHVHAATDLFDRGELDEEDLDANLLPYLNAYKLFLQETGFKVTHSEEFVYHPRYHYAGRLDKRGTWKGTTWLLDLKSGVVPRTVGLQTSAYQMACEEKPRRRLCLQLKRNAYKLHRCDETTDWHYFLSAVNLYFFNDRTFHDNRNETEENRASA